MPLISRNCIENIREKVNIVDVVSPYVTLKQTGNSWKGISPFTNEKTPSFFALPEKNIFKCFSSGYAGDIFRFLQLKENLSFNEAVEAIAHKFNITLEYENEGQGPTPQTTSIRKEIFDLYEAATDFFHQSFLQDTAIQEYWTQKRQFSLETAKKHQIGFAPPEKQGLINFLLKKKPFSPQAIHDSGLFYKNKNDNTLHNLFPRFLGRLIIPIRDVQGRTVAFAGRQLPCTPATDPAKEAKYINSPETPIFHKGRTLFGLDHARNFTQKENHFILVEGQLDAIRCWECGLNTAVAPQGTAITEQQLATLRRYSGKIYCILDGDEAGQKAALRIIPISLKVGIDMQFTVLENGTDPDSLLAEGDTESFSKKMQNSISGIKFIIKSLSPDPGSLSPQEKTNILNNIFEIIAETESAVAQEDYLSEASNLLHINKYIAEKDFTIYKNKKKLTKNTPVAKKTAKKGNQKLTSVEYQLLLLIFNDDKIAHAVAQVLDSEWIISQSPYALLLSKVLAEIREGIWAGASAIDELLEDEEERNLAYNIISEDLPYEDPYKTANICIKNIYTTFMNQRKRQIEDKIANASNTDSKEELRSLLEERLQIRQLLQNPPQLNFEENLV